MLKLNKKCLFKMSIDALTFEVNHGYSTIRSRVGRLTLSLNHTLRGLTETPVFIIIGTRGREMSTSSELSSDSEQY